MSRNSFNHFVRAKEGLCLEEATNGRAAHLSDWIKRQFDRHMESFFRSVDGALAKVNSKDFMAAVEDFKEKVTQFSSQYQAPAYDPKKDIGREEKLADLRHRVAAKNSVFDDGRQSSAANGPSSATFGDTTFGSTSGPRPSATGKLRGATAGGKPVDRERSLGKLGSPQILQNSPGGLDDRSDDERRAIPTSSIDQNMGSMFSKPPRHSSFDPEMATDLQLRRKFGPRNKPEPDAAEFA